MPQNTSLKWLRSAILSGRVTYKGDTIFWKYENKGSPWQKGARKIITPYSWHGKGHDRRIDKERDTYDFSGPATIVIVEEHIRDLGGNIATSERKDRIIQKSNGHRQTVYGWEITFSLSRQVEEQAIVWRNQQFVQSVRRAGK